MAPPGRPASGQVLPLSAVNQTYRVLVLASQKCQTRPAKQVSDESGSATEADFTSGAGLTERRRERMLDKVAERPCLGRSSLHGRLEKPI